MTQESVVIRASATGSSRLIMLVTGGFGLVALAGAVHDFVDAKIGSGIILIIVGSLALAMVTLFMTMRTTLDATGIHIGSAIGARDVPWPASRTGLFVRVRLATGKAILIANNAQAMVVTPEGRAVSLTGLIWMGPLPDTIEAKGVAEIDRIWQWALARGYAHETGWYTELRGAQKLLQIQRRKQEERYGLV
ncbi:hypothetical protein [Actinomyces gerencseriae]|uniref:hypothetical protein n=1 Tax=Actinomyces gerencseriae TaxID=52769 RepID=UPI0023F1E344|nr:hypothetical protein [Actinomyces gerencseriae]